MEVELKAGGGLNSFSHHLRALTSICSTLTIAVRHDRWFMSAISPTMAAYAQVSLAPDIFSQWQVLNVSTLRAARRIPGEVLLKALRHRPLDPLARCLLTLTSQSLGLRVVSKGGRERVYRLRVEETAWVTVNPPPRETQLSSPASVWVATLHTLPPSDTVTVGVSPEGCRLAIIKGGLHSTAFIASDDWSDLQFGPDVIQNLTILRADWLTAWKLAEVEGVLLQWRLGSSGPCHLVIEGASGSRAEFILSCIEGETEPAEMDQAEGEEEEIPGTPDQSSDF